MVHGLFGGSPRFVHLSSHKEVIKCKRFVICFFAAFALIAGVETASAAALDTTQLSDITKALTLHPLGFRVP